MAILDIHDLGLAREKGADLVGVMAFVQAPLAAVLAQPEIRTPKDLEGERAGVSGLPSDEAVLRSIVQGAGGDPDEVKQTTIGFEAVKALLAKRVAGATAFWNVEGVALRAQRPGIREFRVDRYGAPSYPELVLTVTRKTLQEKPLVRATIRALQRGYGVAQEDPESAVSAMLDAERGLNRADLAAQLDAVAPEFTAGADEFGQLRPDVLRAWSEWDAEFGILKAPIDVQLAFDEPGREAPDGLVSLGRCPSPPQLVVVGAGQAGLAVSHELERAEVDHVVLERGKVAQRWRDRWNSFCLVTPNWSIRLPGAAYEGDDPDGFLARDAVVDHLGAYARRLRAPCTRGSTSTRSPRAARRLPARHLRRRAAGRHRRAVHRRLPAAAHDAARRGAAARRRGARHRRLHRARRPGVGPVLVVSCAVRLPDRGGVARGGREVFLACGRAAGRAGGSATTT